MNIAKNCLCALGNSIKRNENAVFLSFGFDLKLDICVCAVNRCFSLAIKLKDVKLYSVCVIVIGACALLTYGKNSVFSYIEREREEVVGVIIPFCATTCLVCKKMCPFSIGEIIVNIAVFLKDGGNKDAFAEHILGVKTLSVKILFKFQRHCAHYGNAVTVSLNGFCENIGHKRAFKLGKMLCNRASLLAVLFPLLAKEPGNSGGCVAVES